VKLKKRWILLSSLLGFLLLVSLVLTILIWTGWLGERLRTFTIDSLEELTGWDFEIENLRGNLLTGVVAEGVRITRPNEGRLLAKAKQITAKYDVLDLILGSKDVGYVTIEAPFVDLAADWSLRGKPQSQEQQSRIPDFSVKGFEIQTGKVVGIPRVEQIDSMDLQLSISATDNRIEFTLIRCAMNVHGIGVKTIISRGLFENGTLNLRKFQLATEKSTVDLKGTVTGEGVLINGETMLELEEVARLFALPHLSGRLHSLFSVRKTRDSGGAEGTIIMNHGIFDRYSLGDLIGEFSSDLKKLVVDVRGWSIGDGEAAGSFELDLKSSAVSATVSGTDLDLSRVSDQLENLSSTLNFEAMINLASTAPSLRGSAHVTLQKSSVREFLIDDLSTKINFEPEFLEIEDLRLTSRNASATARGKIYESAIDLKVETKGIELSHFSDVLGIENLSGELFADLLIQGDPQKPFLIGTFWAKELLLPHTQFGYLSGNLSFQYSKENPRIGLQILVTEGAVFGRRLSDLNVNVNGEGVLFSYSADFGLEEVSAELAGEVIRSRGETRVVNHHLTFFSNRHSITADGDLVLILAPYIKLEATKFSFCNGWIELSGAYSSPNVLEAALAGKQIDLQHLAEFMGMKHILRGHLDLDLHLMGPFSQPEFNLEAEIDDFAYEYTNLQRVEMEIAYTAHNLNVVLLNLEGDNGTYSIHGYLPVDLSPAKPALIDGEMELVVDVGGLEPWMLHSVGPYVELKECQLDGNLRIHGTPIDPRMSGTLTLKNGQFYSKLLKTFITDLDARLALENKEIWVNPVSGKTEQGTLRAQGTIRLEKLVPETIDMEVDLVKLPVRGIEDVFALIDADIRISGELQEPSIEGKIGIEDLLITTPFQQTSGSRTEQKPLEFRCNLSVDANRSIWIRNQNANIQLDGEITVKVKERVLFLSGELNTVRGWVNYYEREFEIVKGRFKFTDIPEINPELDILAETEVMYTAIDNGLRTSKRDVIRLRISGFMQTPEVSLSSESGELSELDIFSLLTLNMTWAELSSEERMDILREQATGRVLDLAASQVTQQIRQAVGLDALRIKVRPLGEEAGAKLTVGKYVSRDLYVSYVSELFSTAKDQFRVEYFVGKRGSLVGERNEEGRYFIGLNYKLRY